MEVEFSPKALKELRKLPKNDSKAIVSKLKLYAKTGQGDVIALQGSEGYRLRHGNWRALFVKKGNVFVLQVVKRGQAYR